MLPKGLSSPRRGEHEADLTDGRRREIIELGMVMLPGHHQVRAVASLGRVVPAWAPGLEPKQSEAIPGSVHEELRTDATASTDSHQTRAKVQSDMHHSTKGPGGLSGNSNFNECEQSQHRREDPRWRARRWAAQA